MRLSKSIYIVGSGNAGFGLTNAYDCNVYLIDCKEELVLIDSGSGLEPERILEQITFHGFQPKDINKILITHAHADHGGGAGFLKKYIGAEVYAYGKSADYISQGDEEAISLASAREAGVYPQNYRIRPCLTKTLGDGETIRAGTITFTVMESLGHCSGHCSYYAEIDGKKVLFSGDSFFAGGKIALQPIWDCNIMEYKKTAEKFAKLPVDALIPSHHELIWSGGESHIQKVDEIFSKLKMPGNAG